MANRDGAYGLRPLRHLSGGCIRTSEYSIASTLAEDICTGAPVQMTGTGKNVALAEQGNVDNIGVFAGCRYVNTAGKQVFSQYWPTGTTATEIVAFVWDDPQIVFSGQTATMAAGDVGTLTEWDGVTGSTATGQSTAELATFATTGKSLRVMGLLPDPENAYGTYARAEVMFAEHVLSGVVSGVGGI